MRESRLAQFVGWFGCKFGGHWPVLSADWLPRQFCGRCNEWTGPESLRGVWTKREMTGGAD